MSKKKTEDRCRSCIQAEIDIERLEAENEQLLTRLRRYELVPDCVVERRVCRCGGYCAECCDEAAKGGRDE